MCHNLLITLSKQKIYAWESSQTDDVTDTCIQLVVPAGFPHVYTDHKTLILKKIYQDVNCVGKSTCLSMSFVYVISVERTTQWLMLCHDCHWKSQLITCHHMLSGVQVLMLQYLFQLIQQFWMPSRRVMLMILSANDLPKWIHLVQS